MIFNNGFFEVFIPPYILIGISVLFTFVITAVAIPSIVRVSRIKGLMAHPNGRTSHIDPTPNLGGVAIFAGVIISSVLFTGIPTAHELKYVIAGMLIIFFWGLKDDLHPMVAYKKFLGQVIAIMLIIVPGDFHLVSLHGLLGIEELSYALSIPLTFILFLALINSFNLIDGIDGLSSGVGIITSLFFGIGFLLNHHMSYAIMSFILATSLIAFFIYNVFGKENKIFLGDTGSMMIGYLLSIFAVRFLNFENATTVFDPDLSTPAVMLCVLIVPLFDTARVFVLRLLRGKSPFAADRSHIHHRLLDISGSHIKATSIILSVNLIFIAIALIFRNIGNELLILIALVLASLLSFIPIYIIRNRTGSWK
jgi:UDP-N-acetylmuramyl pentapeptide phosphotransferase/UDP-N-acetylglucosamine-1-phosphate transferase